MHFGIGGESFELPSESCIDSKVSLVDDSSRNSQDSVESTQLRHISERDSNKKLFYNDRMFEELLQH